MSFGGCKGNGRIRDDRPRFICNLTCQITVLALAPGSCCTEQQRGQDQPVCVTWHLSNLPKLSRLQKRCKRLHPKDGTVRPETVQTFTSILCWVTPQVKSLGL